MDFFFELLSPRHDRENFECGVRELDLYLRAYSGQDVRRNLSSVHVFTSDGEKIIGFYTLSQFSVIADEFPPNIANKLPSKRSVPCTLLGRLAVDKNYAGRGFGRVLLFDAMRKTVSASKNISSFALIVDAKDDAAKRFYVKYGFREFKDSPLRLFAPTHVINKICY